MDDCAANLPNNSYKAHNESIIAQSTPEASKPITEKPDPIEGVVKREKKSLGARMSSMFRTEGQSFAEHLVEQVVVPTIKGVVVTIVAQAGDAVRMMFEQMLYPGQAPTPNSRPVYTPGRPVSYNNYSAANGVPVTTTRVPSSGYQPVRRSNVVDNLKVNTRELGDDILARLDRIIDRQGHCTVGDFYEIANEPSTSTDHQWGWRDISGARVNVVRGGFLVCMPEPDSIPSR
jgi:hypothetical protein